MKTIHLVFFTVLLTCLVACKNEEAPKTNPQERPKHHLNIPLGGIESMQEENTQKIIEGTDGSIIVFIGEITRKRVSVSLRRDQEIIEEKILREKDAIGFTYEGVSYTLTIKNIKKPLVGSGKVEFSLK